MYAKYQGKKVKTDHQIHNQTHARSSAELFYAQNFNPNLDVPSTNQTRQLANETSKRVSPYIHLMQLITDIYKLFVYPT